MNVKLLLISLTCILFQASQVFAAGLWLYEPITSDMGISYAGQSALADDASTAFTNPAGMVALDGSEFGMSMVPLNVNGRFDGVESSNTGGNGGQAGGFVPAGSIFHVERLDPDWAVGISVSSFFGLGVDYNDDWVGRYYAKEATFETVAVVPTAAYKITDSLSIGAGPVFNFGSLNQKVAINNALDADFSDGELLIDETDVGYGARVGLHWEPVEGTKLGFTYNSEISHDLGDVADVSGVGPRMTTALTAAGLIGSEMDVNLTIPTVLELGITQEVSDDWMLLGTLNWQDWSKYGKGIISVQTPDASSYTVDPEYKDTIGFALGSRYRIATDWIWSAGFAYDSSPINVKERTPDAPLDRQVRYATGFIYEVNPCLDVYFAYSYLDAGSAGIDTGGSPLTGTIKGDYSSNEVHFWNFSTNWKF